MKRFIVYALFVMSCCAQLNAMSDELLKKAWFVCPWEKIQETFEPDQQTLNLNIKDLVHYKKYLPVWATDQWVTTQVTCAQQLVQTEFLLTQEYELDDSHFFNQHLKQLFEQALKIYKDNACAEQLKPFDVFMCSPAASDERSQGYSKVWYCMLVPTSMRNESEIIIEKSSQQKEPIIIEQGAHDSIAGVLFLVLVYGVLAGVAYVFEIDNL